MDNISARAFQSLQRLHLDRQQEERDKAALVDSHKPESAFEFKANASHHSVAGELSPSVQSDHTPRFAVAELVQKLGMSGLLAAWANLQLDAGGENLAFSEETLPQELAIKSNRDKMLSAVSLRYRREQSAKAAHKEMERLKGTPTHS